MQLSWRDSGHAWRWNGQPSGKHNRRSMATEPEPVQGELGLGADNMISARLVTADGTAKTVSATENSDLWWAIRGAGHNFGIISSVTIKTSPELNGGVHYQTFLVFPPDKLEQVAEVATTLEMASNLVLDLLFLRAPPDFHHVVAVSVWHGGSEESAKKLIAPLLELDPFIAAAGMVPYDHTNDGLDYLCFTGPLVSLLLT